MEKNKVGKFLSAKREAHNLSREEVAAKAGCNISTITRIEGGTTRIQRTKIGRYANAYGVSLEELASVCGYEMSSLPRNPNSSVNTEVSATVEDLEFLISVAKGLKSPMSLKMIYDLLQRRQTPN